MTLGDLLAEVVRGLDAAGIPHMVAGSVASTLHGEPVVGMLAEETGADG